MIVEIHFTCGWWPTKIDFMTTWESICLNVLFPVCLINVFQMQATMFLYEMYAGTFPYDGWIWDSTQAWKLFHMMAAFGLIHVYENILLTYFSDHLTLPWSCNMAKPWQNNIGLLQNCTNEDFFMLAQSARYKLNDIMVTLSKTWGTWTSPCCKIYKLVSWVQA